MFGPLDDVRILDLTTVVLGPYATQIFGDMGADVVKVETPSGDSTRSTGPRRSPDMAAIFMGVNRNKRSIVLDLKQAPACAALGRLIDRADVLIHNMRPQKAAKLGLSPAEVLRRNPRIVYAGLYGYRNGGPYSGKPAYDDVIQCQSGVASLMAVQTGRPRYAPTVIADKTSALAATYSVLAALFKRERTGKGQIVEVPMFETMASFILLEHLFGKTFVGEDWSAGYNRVLDPFRQPYQTSDGFIGMMAYSDLQWARFWQEVGKSELVSDRKFNNLTSRTENISELYRTAAECFRNRTTAEWESVLSKLEIPNARINSLDDLLADPHLNSVGFFRRVKHATEGEIILTDAPTRFNGEVAAFDRLQPHLGEHSIEILREAGASEEEIRVLLETKATIDWRRKPGEAGNAKSQGTESPP